MTESGKTLAGRYRIESVLGQGGMGAVYLASQEALGKKVAIKEMELRGFSQRELEAAVKQFKSEATFLANLDHPNLVQVTDFFVEGDRHYLVMAYVTGQTLQQKLRARGRPFGWPQVLEWARPLCGVLAYLHSQDPPILFRDLKPSNIMVDDSGRLRLIDFGIARTGQEGEKTSTFLQGTGTSGFSPLEQYSGGQSTDHRSDIYSLGATLYQLLTGTVPPDAVSRVSQGAPVLEPSKLIPEIPKALDSVLLKALGQNKADRHQSIAEFAAEMEAVGLGEDSETEDLRQPVLAMANGAAVAAPPPSGGLSKPNITVELMPSGPNTSPLAVAAGLGAAAVVTLMLGSFFLSRHPAGATANAGSTPSAPPVATQVAESKDPVKTTVPKPPAPKPTTSETRVRPVSDNGEESAGERIRQPKPPVASQPPTRPEASQPKPAPRVKVVKAVASAKVRETAPTARRPSPRRIERTAEPTSLPEETARPTETAPMAGPPPFTPPEVPEGMPEPVYYDAQGNPLPPNLQPAGFPGAPRGPGKPMPGPRGAGPHDGPPLEGPPGYETRTRRNR